MDGDHKQNNANSSWPKEGIKTHTRTGGKLEEPKKKQWPPPPSISHVWERSPCRLPNLQPLLLWYFL